MAMLPSTLDIARGLYVATRLFTGRPDAFHLADATVEGFWKSLFAAVLALPPFLGARAVGSGAGLEDGPALTMLLLTYAVGILLYPVVMLNLADAIGRSGRYLTYMVAYNWSILLQTLIALAVALVIATGLLPRQAALLLQAVTAVAIIWYLWFMARHGLEVGPLMASGVVTVDVALALLIDNMRDGLG